MFERLDSLIGKEQRKNMQKVHVLLVGLGGVGGACFEALVRLGIGKITIVDGDVFAVSNLNRQLLALKKTVGRKKVDIALERAQQISDVTEVICHDFYISDETIDSLNFSDYDYVIDCCDMVNAKVLLIEKSLEFKVPVISSTGTGNRLDASKLEVISIWKTSYDPLSKVLRKRLREKNIFAEIPVLYSREIPIKIDASCVASCSVVPNVAGFLIASFVFSAIIGSRK